MNLEEQLNDLGRRAKDASHVLAAMSAEQKNAALWSMADELESMRETLQAENAKDLEAAASKGLSDAMVDRLRLTDARIDAMCEGVRRVAVLPDPVGETLKAWTREDGLRIQKVRVPLGVIGIIYESRPNVTCDAAVLCIKTGNAVVLRGGSEAIHSNRAIARALQVGGQKSGLPEGSVVLVPVTDREAVRLMARMSSYLDVIIPRGGKGLIETVVEHARVPVIKHYDGLCVGYVDRAADVAMATEIVVNAKTQRPGVCNALETLLVDEAIAESFLPVVARELGARGVEIRGDETVHRILGDVVVPATEEDWITEFLDLVLAVKVVGGVDDAIRHANTYGSHHSDVIVTSDAPRAEKFLREVDSATVYWNASTRFTDGAEFGFGAEIGISTDKLHARGPMALEELTSYKYLLRGDGQVKG